MRFLRAAAVLAIAAGLVIGWMYVQPAVDSATSKLASAVTSSGPVTYYIRPGGSDAASGTSPGSAWRTLARASTAVLRPGDRLRLLGGRKYRGQLRLTRGDGGNPRKPVRVSSYGTGRATIATSTSGIVVFNTSGIAIRNLVLVGHNAMRSGTSGIAAYSSRTSGRLRHVYVSHVNISRFGSGISLGAAHDGAGFSNVRVTNSALHGNLDAGFASYGPDFNPAAPAYAHQGIYLAHVRAFRNLGDPATSHNTGSGIELGSVSKGRVVDSQAFANGGQNGGTSEGPIGMWTYDSTRVVMAHDVSHGNKSANIHDGGGFGLDREVSHSVLEYDLSYDNHGAGFLLYSTQGASGHQSGSVVRFNISYGDVRGRNHVIGALEAEGKVSNSSLYQNTIIVTGSNTQPAFKATGDLHHVRVLNNILIAASGAVTLATEPLPTSAVLFAGNDYLSSAGTWVVQWGTKTHYDSLATWRHATGNEEVDGHATGHVVAPMFVGPLSPSQGGAGFMLRPRSKLVHAGLNLTLRFGIRPGPVTYGGNANLVRSPNIGAQ